jgi:RNA polymerase sigma-70 factor (ECF subfamily)
MSSGAEQPSDDDVIDQVRQGRTDAFEVLVARYEDDVFRWVRRRVPAGEVEDTAQEVFIRAYRSLPGYRGRGPAFRSWLAAIATRTCCDHWRRAYRNRETPLSVLSDAQQTWLEAAMAQTAARDLEQAGAAEEAREILEAALSRLPPEDRMVLEMVYLEGRSGREAGKLLNWSTAKVKVRCFRARRKLERFLLTVKKREGL